MKKRIFLFGSFLLCMAATKAQTSISSVPTYSWQNSQLPREFSGKLQIGFVSAAQGFPTYGAVLAGGGYSSAQDGSVFQLYFPYSSSYGGLAPRIRLGSYNNAGWSDWQDMYTSANANNVTASWTAKTMYVVDKLGIGTTTPKEMLSVNGKIRAQEVKVETANWPDYVFADGYQLPSLKETAQFIEQNKHLPGVPKASEVEENGLSLGEMNRILLQKVEELTLHMIDKDKKIESQNKSLQEVVERLHKLEKSILK